MPSFTLYRSNGACSLGAHVLLKELGLDYKSVQMDWSPEGKLSSKDGTVSAEEYLKIHPEALVPALQFDNETLTENLAILTYLGSLAPERKLNGKTDLEHARVLEWLTYLVETLHGRGYGMLFTPFRFSTDSAHVDAIKAKGREKIEETYAKVNQRIGDKTFPVGDSETVVDYFLIPLYYWGLRMGFDMTKYPNYSRVIKRMEEKASVKATKEEEGFSHLSAV